MGYSTIRLQLSSYFLKHQTYDKKQIISSIQRAAEMARSRGVPSEERIQAERRSGIIYSTRTEPWARRLADGLGETFSCSVFETPKGGNGQTSSYHIGFKGMSYSVDVCIALFLYAYGSIASYTSNHMVRDDGETAAEFSARKMAYAKSVTDAIQTSLCDQVA